MKTIKLLILISIGCLFAGCATTSKFTLDTIRPGMSKEDVIKILGEPDHVGFLEEDDGTLFETLVYTERVIRDDWYVYDNILEFKNNYLKSRYKSPERYHSKISKAGSR